MPAGSAENKLGSKGGISAPVSAKTGAGGRSFAAGLSEGLPRGPASDTGPPLESHPAPPGRASGWRFNALCRARGGTKPAQKPLADR
jgi:hypothetical protein